MTEEGSAWKGKVARIAPFVLLLAIPALVAPVLLTKSMTADEYTHVAAGALTLETGSFRPNWEQPPLVKLLCAFPLRLAGIVSVSADPEESDDVKEAYRRFWFENEIDLDAILLRARVPTVLISIALGALVWVWARSLYGPWGGIVSLVAYAFSPTILAHTALVTTDLIGAAGFLLALRLFWGACRDPSRTRLALFGASVGIACLCKFSGVILIPAVAVFLVWSVIRARFGGEGHALGIHRFLPRGGAGAKAALLALAIPIGSAGLVTWAGYGFETAPLSGEAKLPKNEKLKVLLLTNPALMKVYRTVGEKIPLPAPSFIRGLEHVRKHNRHGHHAFFLGERSEDGWLAYFPVAFVLKTSLPLLAILFITLVTCPGGRSKVPSVESLLLLAALTYFLIAMVSRINIGIRHILPVYPILCILAGRLVTIGWFSRKAGVVLIVLLLGWHAVEAIRISPHYLAYFQPLCGGPSRGYHYLVDSNLDWGQDLRALARELEEEGRPEIHLAYFGSLDPATYGIRYKPLPPDEEVPGRVVISASSLQLGVIVKGGRVGEDPFGWLRRYDPYGSVGYSILYYQIPRRE